jgi:hypothetical protein
MAYENITKDDWKEAFEKLSDAIHMDCPPGQHWFASNETMRLRGLLMAKCKEFDPRFDNESQQYKR